MGTPKIAELERPRGNSGSVGSGALQFILA